MADILAFGEFWRRLSRLGKKSELTPVFFACSKTLMGVLRFLFSFKFVLSPQDTETKVITK